MRNVRVRYEKTGDARFVSHLDLVRTFARAVRRADLNVYYTEGFNPHIKMNFLPPLSLGYESLCEAFDMRLIDETPCADVASRLRAVLPDLLRVFDAYEPETELTDVAFVRYAMRFDADVNAAAAALGREGLTIEKKTKRGQITVDVHSALREAEVVDGALEIVLPMGEASLNPRHVVEALNTYGGFGIEDFRCVRKQLYAADGGVFM
ncbi:MAG: TIGR03936 family radical SAM-associated protein [Clostridia bacterium]|nr:TIGR03936 family radical SAM-associated protein [Clostridia bacterium]